MQACRAGKITACCCVLAMVSPSTAFRSVAPYEIHRQITVAGIFEDFADPKTLKRILRANDNTDWDEAKLNDHALHFDSEAFTQSTERLAKNLNDGIFLLSICEKKCRAHEDR